MTKKKPKIYLVQDNYRLGKPSGDGRSDGGRGGRSGGRGRGRSNADRSRSSRPPRRRK